MQQDASTCRMRTRMLREQQRQTKRGCDPCLRQQSALTSDTGLARVLETEVAASHAWTTRFKQSAPAKNFLDNVAQCLDISRCIGLGVMVVGDCLSS